MASGRKSPSIIGSLRFGRSRRFGQEGRQAHHDLLAIERAHASQSRRVELHLQLFRRRGSGWQVLHWLLLSGGDVTGRVSPKTAPTQQVIKISKRAEVRSGAGHRIEHPRSQSPEDAWMDFNMNEPAGPAPIDTLAPQVSAKKRVPAVTHHDNLPDMGRMNGR